MAVLKIEDYYRLVGEPTAPTLLEAVHAIPGGVGIDLELPERRKGAMDHRIPSLDEGDGA